MKAVAPERIYIHPTLDSVWGMSERSCENEIEYVCTDAFIEKAYKWMEAFLNAHYVMRYGDCCEPSNDVILEGFKNYMKG